MSKVGPLRLILRTTADVCIGLILFLTFALALGAYERNAAATHRLSGLLSISSSAGDLLKFSLDDSPLIAAAVVASAVPVPQTGAFAVVHRPSDAASMLLLAAIFSGIVAFNLAFFRHLHREYASPR